MKTSNIKILALFSMTSILLSGCGAGQFLGPTPTPTFTPTITPTFTPTSTSTPTPTFTPTLTPTPLFGFGPEVINFDFANQDFSDPSSWPEIDWKKLPEWIPYLEAKGLIDAKLPETATIPCKYNIRQYEGQLKNMALDGCVGANQMVIPVAGVVVWKIKPGVGYDEFSYWVITYIFMSPESLSNNHNYIVLNMAIRRETWVRMEDERTKDWYFSQFLGIGKSVDVFPIYDINVDKIYERGSTLCDEGNGGTLVLGFKHQLEHTNPYNDYEWDWGWWELSHAEYSPLIQEWVDGEPQIPPIELDGSLVPGCFAAHH